MFSREINSESNANQIALTSKKWRDNDKKKNIMGWCVVDDEDHEKDDGRRREKMNNINPNSFLNIFNSFYIISKQNRISIITL